MYSNLPEIQHETADMPDVRTYIHGDIRSTDKAPPPEGFTEPNPPNGGELISERINTGSGTGPDNLGPFRAATQDELAQGKGFWYNMVGGGYYGLPPDTSQGRQTMPVAKSGASDGTGSTGSASPATPLDPLNNALAGMLGGGGGADITPPYNAASPVATSSGGGSGAAIFVIILLVAGIAGYYYYKHHKKGKGVEHDG